MFLGGVNERQGKERQAKKTAVKSCSTQQVLFLHASFLRKNNNTPKKHHPTNTQTSEVRKKKTSVSPRRGIGLDPGE